MFGNYDDAVHNTVVFFRMIFQPAFIQKLYIVADPDILIQYGIADPAVPPDTHIGNSVSAVFLHLRQRFKGISSHDNGSFQTGIFLDT